jgi:hypothetical protein
MVDLREVKNFSKTDPTTWRRIASGSEQVR